MTNEKIIALANFLEESDHEEINVSSYNKNLFEYGNQEYLVVTDEEADEETEEYIKESVWSFNASFLADQTDMPKEIFEALQSKYEDGNNAVLKLIEKTCGIDEFVKEAVQLDGRGHFLSSYDGNENEEGRFFIYRKN